VREYEVEMGPTDPISGGASAVLETLTTTMMGVADFPIATLKALAIHPDSGKGKGKGKAKEGDKTGSETSSITALSPSATPLSSVTAASSTTDIPRSSTSSDPPGTDSSAPTTPGTMTPTISQEKRAEDASTPKESLTREHSSASTTVLSTVNSANSAERSISELSSVRSPRGGSMAEAMRNLPDSSRPRSTSRGRSPSGGHRRSSSMSKPKHTNTWAEGGSPCPDILDTAYGTGKGIGKISGSLLKSPMDLLLGVSKGFHNMPKLYGEEVRQTDRVTGIKSGFRVAGKVSSLIISCEDALIC
jgi:hypothetical protein